MAASGKIFLCALKVLAVVSLLSFVAQPSLWSQQQTPANPLTITRIEIIGNRRIQRDTLLARIFSRPGDPYSEEAVRRDFQALWNTQFFEDIRLEVENDPRNPNGKIVVFYVTERPIIRRIEYKGNKSVSESDILDAFKDKKVGLSVESQFDPTKITRAEVVIKSLLAAHGHQFATVKPTYERIAATNAVKLVFNIDEGPKVKVGTITIVGNQGFLGAAHYSHHAQRPALLHSPVSHLHSGAEQDVRPSEAGRGHGSRHPRAIPGQRLFQSGRQRSGLEDRGFESAAGCRCPYRESGGKKGKATNITIRIDEGEQYRMGKVSFRSADPDQGLVFQAGIPCASVPAQTGRPLFGRENPQGAR